MNAIPKITNAIPLNNYRLFVEFSDGIKGEINLSNWVGKGLFAEWYNEEKFNKFRITKNGKLHWTEDIEMDPDAFYLKLVDKTFDQYANHL